MIFKNPNCLEGTVDMNMVIKGDSGDSPEGSEEHGRESTRHL